MPFPWSSLQFTAYLFIYFISAEDSASSVTAKLQQLNLQNDDRGPPPEEDNPSVIIPNHLQVHTPDCSHLSFGSFGSGIGSAFSGPFASRPLKSNLEEASEPADVSSIAHSDTRYAFGMARFSIFYLFLLYFVVILTCFVQKSRVLWG